MHVCAISGRTTRRTNAKESTPYELEWLAQAKQNGPGSATNAVIRGLTTNKEWM